MSIVPVARLIKHRVIYIAGEEAALRKEALDAVLAGLEMNKDDFDLEQFDGDGSSPIQWLGSVGTSPFMAPRRVVIVRHLLRTDPDKLKAVNLATIPDSGMLILVADEESGADDRQARMKTADKNWRKAVEKAGGMVFEAKIDPKKTKDEVKVRLNQLGKTISERALENLLQMTGGSLSRVLDELEKLSLYIGDQPQIRETDVRMVVMPSQDWNVFSMVNAIVAGNVGEALRQLRILIISPQKAENAAHAQILPQISRSLRLLWQARVCLDAGVSPGDAPEAIRKCFPDRPNLANENPYGQGIVMGNARRVTLDRLVVAFGILSDADARLKGALDGFSATETLERMVLEMAQALAPASARA